MTINKPHILITRPAEQGQKLAQQLRNFGLNSTCQPLFDYTAKDSAAVIKTHLANHFSPKAEPILIFISVAAVTFANKTSPLTHWSHSKVIAVGTATQAALATLNIQAICPEQHTSEGVLALPELNTRHLPPIIIVRGNGGREHLAQTLSKRGAKVSYIESYQRVWRTLPQQCAQQWQANGVNCIVITSNSLLTYTVSLFANDENYWKNKCLWIVASQRIADNAKTLDLKNVINAHGANDEAVMAALADNGIL